jgi:hypothetical protein
VQLQGLRRLRKSRSNVYAARRNFTAEIEKKTPGFQGRAFLLRRNQFFSGEPE